MCHCGLVPQCARAAEAPAAAVSLPMQDTVALGADDTLEFTLQLPKPPRDAIVTQPDVGVWLLRSGEAVPAPDAAPPARALVWPSPRPGEWLVHLRGLKAPQSREGSWDLLVRWAVGGTLSPASRGELRIPGRIAFKAEAADVVLLTDGSLSMGRNDPKRLRVDAAREFIAEARRTGSIGRIAIVQFDNRSRTVIGLTPANSNFEDALEKLDERGETDIDGGIRHALQLLTSANERDVRGTTGVPPVAAPATAAGANIVLLTDGRQEPGQYGNAHEMARKAGVAVHTLALGRDADRPLLKRIAEETGGTFADAAKDRDLTLAYAAIASSISRARTVMTATLREGVQAVPVPVDGSCRALTFEIGSQRPGVLNVQRPNRQAWTSPSQASPKFFVELPEEGKWLAEWNPGPAAAPAQPDTLLASARTALYPMLFRADAQPNVPFEIDTDEPAVAVSLCEGAEPFAGATVQVSLQFENPARTVTALLHDDGQHADGAAGDGIYATYLPPADAANLTGAYPENAAGTLKAVVTGSRLGQEFRREAESRFIFRRHEGPALIATGPADLGRRFAGETATADVQLRVRGAGGPLQARFQPPLQSGVQDISPCARAVEQFAKLFN
ncbi:MAG: VWA domain-containing protein, partial [Planctomycetota bacterium]|nr:VWA domain-containing protein [Planctomycetota bacterium]